MPLAVLTLVAAQHAFLSLLLHATYEQRQLPGFMSAMPVRFISGLANDNLPASYDSGFTLLVVIEACALAALYCGLKRIDRRKLAFVAGGALVAIADAAWSRAATSADMYSYVGFTLLGTRAYAPPGLTFPGEYALINAWWHTPMVAAPYGPLWLGTANAVTAYAHTLFAKIVALRVLGAFTLLGIVAALAALKVPLRIVALFALNPALIFQFVANVHNDLLGVLLVLVARYATARGAVWRGIAFAVAAGLVKLPFLWLAALAYVPLPSQRRRFQAFALTATLGIALSWLAGGHPYLAALLRHVDESTGGHPMAALGGASILLKIVAVAAVILALVSGLFVEGCTWALPALGAVLHPWYLCWALPYAMGSQDALRNFAIALPVAMLVTDGALGRGALAGVIAALVLLWLAVSLARELTGRLRMRDLQT